MKWIKFNNLTFRAPVGYYEEEGILQNNIVVNVHLHNSKKLVYRTDTVIALVAKQVKQRTMLIERLAAAILLAVTEHYGPMKRARVQIRKVPPPMLGRIGASFVEMESEKEDGVLPLGRIGVEGMHFDTHWGEDDQERLLGYRIEIDVRVIAPLLAAADADDLAQTVNYQGIYDVCRFVADDRLSGPTEATIEIERRLKALFGNLFGIEVIIQRPAPHPEHATSTMIYTRAKEYIATCPRCSGETTCYQSSDCWCQKERLFSRTLDILAKQYGDECLCQSCLKTYAR